MKVKINEPIKDGQVAMGINKPAGAVRPSKLIPARPKESVDPDSRDKSILGSCNR